MNGRLETTVPEIRHAEQGALVGELVVALVLRDDRHQQQRRERHRHGAEQDEQRPVLRDASDHADALFRRLQRLHTQVAFRRLAHLIVSDLG